MVKLGLVSNTTDTSRFYIRITFEDKSTIKFGETISVRSIVSKVNILDITLI